MDFSQLLQPCRDFWLLLVSIATVFAIIQNYHLEYLHQSERNELQKHKARLDFLEQQLTLLSKKEETPYAASMERALRRERSAECPQKCRGPRGYDGVKGERGSLGEKGSKGESGNQGIIGRKGEKGHRGPPGFTGSKGERGSHGRKGAKGEQGLAIEKEKLVPLAHIVGDDKRFNHVGKHQLSTNLWNKSASICNYTISLVEKELAWHLVMPTGGVYFVYAQLNLLENDTSEGKVGFTLHRSAGGSAEK
ncbi:adiponectin-like isoform X2 [Corticium candelabrum]|uniref:adiponectin-like isoform X2 n=1 Tax=Corticium candelabrum TaxID=121492 RepID=UPI002E270736|nr:adiponectin-like isoform X2 [Corticium candelabrum]